GGGPLASYYVGRNTIYLIAKDLPLPVILHNLPRMAGAQARFALQALRHIREPAARARLRGILSGRLPWPRVLGTRKRVLRSARVSAGVLEGLMRGFVPGVD